MINILLSGCLGRMGANIIKCAQDDERVNIVAGVDKNDPPEDFGFPVYKSFSEIRPDTKFDVIIDFSNPSTLTSLLDIATKRKTPAVIATTGLSDDQKELLKSASQSIAVFSSANMSIGISLITELSKTAAKVLGPAFDIEILEAHHAGKLDAPSGTALMIADGVSSVLDESPEYIYDRHNRREKRPKNEIGIHSIRGGTIVGEHEVIFAGHDEMIYIKHTALSREIFAVGAINAAVYLTTKEPGLYSMTDMINE